MIPITVRTPIGPRWSSGHPKWGQRDTYVGLLELRDRIASDPDYPPKERMSTWNGMNLLKDGHHHVAAICELYSPDRTVEVVRSSEEFLNDHDRCSRPCAD